MIAILKEIEVTEFWDNMFMHPTKMLFVETEDNDEIYRLGTTIETQFCKP